MMESNQIVGGFWNIRGLNKTGRLKCLADFINQNRLDFVGIQETKKASIKDSFLESVNKHMMLEVCPCHGYCWGYFSGL
jgi:exonuclease III